MIETPEKKLCQLSAEEAKRIVDTSAETFRDQTRNKCGNVFMLFEDFLSGIFNCYTQVGIDWYYVEGVHQRNEYGIICSWSSHPKWYRCWLKENGRGEYGTRKEVAA